MGFKLEWLQIIVLSDKKNSLMLQWISIVWLLTGMNGGQ